MRGTDFYLRSKKRRAVFLSGKLECARSSENIISASPLSKGANLGSRVTAALFYYYCFFLLLFLLAKREFSHMHSTFSSPLYLLFFENWHPSLAPHRPFVFSSAVWKHIHQLSGEHLPKSWISGKH